MLKLVRNLTLASVLPLAVVGCQTQKVASNDGAGFEKLTPSGATRNFIIKNDHPFAVQVVAHNITCDALPACKK